MPAALFAIVVSCCRAEALVDVASGDVDGQGSSECEFIAAGDGSTIGNLCSRLVRAAARSPHAAAIGSWSAQSSRSGAPR